MLFQLSTFIIKTVNFSVVIVNNSFKFFNSLYPLIINLGCMFSLFLFSRSIFSCKHWLLSSSITSSLLLSIISNSLILTLAESSGESVRLVIMGSRVRIRLVHLFQIFISSPLFLKNSKSGVDDWGHRLRSRSPVTIYPPASSSPLGCDFVTSLLRYQELAHPTLACSLQM